MPGMDLNYLVTQNGCDELNLNRVMLLIAYVFAWYGDIVLQIWKNIVKKQQLIKTNVYIPLGNVQPFFMFHNENNA